jgi:hypothetical protein
MLSYIADSVRQLDASVERGFEGIRRELSELPRHYVPRLEIDRRFDEVTLDVGELRRRLEADAGERQRQAERLEDHRRSTRWQVIGLAAGSAVSVFGTLFGVFVHFS